MSELSRKIEAARSHVDRELSSHQVDGQVVRAKQRRQRQVRRRRVSALAMVGVLGATLWLYSRPRHSVVFEDGSTADRLDETSAFQMKEASAHRTVIQISRGGGRFEVARNPERVFRVEAGDVAVEVLGTRFSVERLDEQVRVAVERGRVQVLSGLGRSELGAGETELFPLHPSLDKPPEPEPLIPVVAVEPQEPEAPRAVRAPPPTKPRAANRVSWRASAERGDYHQAWAQLHQPGAEAVRDLAEELLLAADVARLSNHSSEAVPLLEKMVKDHRKDPRAQLAAFTLGRVLLEELGRPHEAADAFSTARSLNPTGPMGNDALAREVEAWSRAGDREHARSRAEEYVRMYPQGAQLQMVRRLGGLQ
jgi:transmembrane sensor